MFYIFGLSISGENIMQKYIKKLNDVWVFEI